eukprot:CAMPEP_0206527414 /NCGR_PEP_ID=MMETSP0325_2-20121206/1330_1 /ASSEMBLY_ACC=CAM_ASM_000347 /TAXON_ID=2866 /ORGANISM="Crypthecodinium cohnii, Strain Seligo" /LENGTH=82 /DNA_ID=CAMNT_0054022811 /DNA_START=688 /DNA_END=936 /DNA_ORIENTATION=+
MPSNKRAAASLSTCTSWKSAKASKTALKQGCSFRTHCDDGVRPFAASGPGGAESSNFIGASTVAAKLCSDFSQASSPSHLTV